ncbi:hypothetical protein [Nocardia grenadensis]|uniref:hypothetical protein n=2 Tax=Nocardia TaxID=1817 RepID=UPI0007A4A8E4|nr:hypothetical protein [Nocardia grenadensis]
MAKLELAGVRLVINGEEVSIPQPPPPEPEPPIEVPPMTREQAIAHIQQLSDQVAMEFCVGRRENDRLDEETRQALMALGVAWEDT